LQSARQAQCRQYYWDRPEFAVPPLAVIARGLCSRAASWRIVSLYASTPFDQIGRIKAKEPAVAYNRIAMHPRMVDACHRAESNRSDRILRSHHFDAVGVECDEIGGVTGRQRANIGSAEQARAVSRSHF